MVLKPETLLLKHCGNEIPYVFARKVGKCPIDNNTDNRRILVKLQYIAHGKIASRTPKYNQ